MLAEKLVIGREVPLVVDVGVVVEAAEIDVEDPTAVLVAEEEVDDTLLLGELLQTGKLTFPCIYIKIKVADNLRGWI